jgi:CrcB protein
MSLMVVICISLGGAAGALARALAGRLIQTDFPLATLIVNTIGSFLLAMAYTGLDTDSILLRSLIGAGFCGAFTTYSTFILETVILFRSAQKRQAIFYAISTIGLCCLASWLGIHWFA